MYSRRVNTSTQPTTAKVTKCGWSSSSFQRSLIQASYRKGTSVDARASGGFREALEVLGDLHAELLHGGQYQRLHPVLLRIDAREQGHAERSGLAGAGLREGIAVAVEQVRVPFGPPPDFGRQGPPDWSLRLLLWLRLGSL